MFLVEESYDSDLDELLDDDMDKMVVLLATKELGDRKKKRRRGSNEPQGEEKVEQEHAGPEHEEQPLHDFTTYQDMYALEGSIENMSPTCTCTNGSW
jgi:hypothetical protein